MSTSTPDEIPVASTSRAQSPQMMTASAIAQLTESIAAITIISPAQAPTASTSKLNPLSAPYVPTGLLVPAVADSAEPEADAQIIEALKSAKDRIYVLKLGESFEALIADRATRTRLDCSAQTTYQRLLVHRCAAYYKLQSEQHPETKTLTVLVVETSRIPARRLSDLVPTLTPPEPAGPTFRIMRRGDAVPTPRSNSESADASDTESVQSQAQKKRRTALTIEQREAAYNAARERIFNKSLQAPSTAETSIASTATDDAESIDGAVAESEVTTLSTCSTSDRERERGRSKSSASASPRGRAGRGRSTSPEYVPYDPAQHGMDLHGSPPSPPVDEIPAAQAVDGGQYTQYGAVYTPAGFPLFAMYPQGQAPQPPQGFYPFPPPRQDQQQQQQPMPMYGPQFVYGPYGWISPPPAQQQQQQQHVQNGQYQQPSQPQVQMQQQLAYPAAASFAGAQPQFVPQPYMPPVVAPPQQQLQSQMPPPPPQPQPMYGPPQGTSTQTVQQLQFGTAPPAPAQAFVPPPAGAPHPPVAINGSTAMFIQQQAPQQPAPQSQQQIQAYPLLQNGFAPPQFVHPGGPPQQQQQQQQVAFVPPPQQQHQMNGHSVYRSAPPQQLYAGRPQQQEQFEGGDRPYNQHQGSIQFGHATPYYGGNEYTTNGRAIPRGNGTVGPRMTRRAASSSSSIATSASSSASGGARTPADETASVASSVASSSSSSSRKTYTSTASGTHPLPARPDWAIGMKPSPPTRHAGLPRHHHQHHHGQQRSRAPQFGTADFPPLSGSGGSGPSARGAWARPMPMARMEYERPPAKGDVELYNPRSGNKAPGGGILGMNVSLERGGAEYTEVVSGTDGSGSGSEQPMQEPAVADGVSAA